MRHSPIRVLVKEHRMIRRVVDTCADLVLILESSFHFDASKPRASIDRRLGQYSNIGQSAIVESRELSRSRGDRNFRELALACRIEEGQNVTIELLAKITAFMQQYADKCHHAKEEDLLFPAFERAGVPSEGCPLAALRYEHKEGRAIVAALHEALQSKRTATILSSLHGIVALYPNHIWKEEFLLFPLAKKLLSPQVQEELFTAFMAVDQALGCDMLNAHVAFAKKLSVLK